MTEVTQEAITSAFEAQRKHQWVQRRTTAAERIEKLKKLRASIEAHTDEVQVALNKDLRRALDNTNEIDACLSEIDDAIANLDRWMEPQTIEPSLSTIASGAKIMYEARGIVLLFGPWNFPFCLTFQPLAQIISAGNCAIVKPNEVTPHVSAVITKIIRAVFQPEEVAVFEGDVGLANRLLELPIDHIFFTGSPLVGKLIMTAAAKHLASVTLELGGKNPVVIDRDANIADAAAKIAVMRNTNSGQVCLCPENIFVHGDNKDEFLTAVQATYQSAYYQDGELNQDAQGKIVDERNWKRVKSYIDDAREKGANVICGGEAIAETHGIQPTILTNVPDDATIMQEEVFGPILSVFTYSDINEVYEKLQQQHKPLALYVFSNNDEFIEDVLANTTSGGVTVNGCALHCGEKNLPFGGVNHSGIGTYHSVYGFRELSNARSVLYLKQ